MTRHSSILPQCISAYKSNIAGFGIGVRYKEDVTDTEELEDEFNRLSDIVELLALDCDTKKKFLRRLLPPVKLMELHIWR